VPPRPIDTDAIRDLGSDAVNAMIADQSNEKARFSRRGRACDRVAVCRCEPIQHSRVIRHVWRPREVLRLR
jgi:hypothetical protein